MMMTRRDAVAAFALFAEFLASARHTNAQTQTAPATPSASPRPPVFKHDLPNVRLDDWEVTVNIVDYEPGRVGAPHRHRGRAEPVFNRAYPGQGPGLAQDRALLSGAAVSQRYSGEFTVSGRHAIPGCRGCFFDLGIQ